jgi:hypothetical protein
MATKIVDREDELIELGLPSDYLASGDRVTIAESETVLRAIIEGVDLVESFDSCSCRSCEQRSGIGIDAIGHCERTPEPAGYTATSNAYMPSWMYRGSLLGKYRALQVASSDRVSK